MPGEGDASSTSSISLRMPCWVADRTTVWTRRWRPRIRVRAGARHARLPGHVNGALKAFLDRFPTDALAGTAVVLAATAGGPTHYLALDTGGRAVVASLSGWTVPTVVYATAAGFSDGVPSDAVLDTLRVALAQARSVAGFG